VVAGFEVDAAEPNPVGVERLLRGLPEWFGIESAVVDYVEDARRLPTVLAWPAGRRDDPIGVLLLRRHFPTAAEIHLMAVRRDWHRCGVGTALVTAAERLAGADGANLLSVKTLGPSHPDPNYRRTRAFYHALGFLPVQELHGLWPDNPCLIMVKPLH
jgi:GNAT superfamily N-acetyltransferase